MIERDIHRAENALGAGLGALHAAGPLNAILLVAGIHVAAFAVYGIHAVFTGDATASFGWGFVTLVMVLLARKVLVLAELPRRFVRWATAAMLLAVPFVTFQPQLVRASQELAEGWECKGWRDDGSLYGGQEWSVNRTNSCMRFLTPADGERSCRAFAATKARFVYYAARDFCSTWIKGAQLQSMRPADPSR